jgi:hypothetical protein
VASNVGVLEFSEGRLTGLHRWTGDNTVVELAFAGRDGLWVHPLEPFSLVRFDGQRWQRMPTPPIPADAIRGEVLEDFRVASDGTRHWLNGFHHVWEWNEVAANWRVIREGEMGQRIFAVPVAGGGLFVIRNQAGEVDWIVHADSVTDTQGRTQATRTEPFLADDVAAISGAAWIRTGAGHVLRASLTSVEDTEVPGPAVAIGPGLNGPPLALVRDQGVYAFDGSWRRRLSWPDGLKIRFLSLPKVTADGDTIAVTANGHLWISRAGGRLEAVPLAQ